MSGLRQYIQQNYPDLGQLYQQLNYDEIARATGAKKEVVAYEIDLIFDELAFGSLATGNTSDSTDIIALLSDKCKSFEEAENALSRMNLTPFVEKPPPKQEPSPPTAPHLKDPDTKLLLPCTNGHPEPPRTSVAPPSTNPAPSTSGATQKAHPTLGTNDVALYPYSHPLEVNPTLVHVTVKATVEPLEPLPTPGPITPHRRFLMSERPKPTDSAARTMRRVSGGAATQSTAVGAVLSGGTSSRRKSSLVSDSLPEYIRHQLQAATPKPESVFAESPPSRVSVSSAASTKPVQSPSPRDQALFPNKTPTRTPARSPLPTKSPQSITGTSRREEKRRSLTSVPPVIDETPEPSPPTSPQLPSRFHNLMSNSQHLYANSHRAKALAKSPSHRDTAPSSGTSHSSHNVLDFDEEYILPGEHRFHATPGSELYRGIEDGADEVDFINVNEDEEEGEEGDKMDDYLFNL